MRKDPTISLMQIVSALSVVTLHANSAFWDFSATDRYWRTANIIESVFYFAVPIFFMISGITLIDYKERYSTGVFFKKRITKTVIPYLAWSIIGLLFLIIKGDIDSETITLEYLINGIVNGKIISIYWFFPVLFSIYLSLPLFASVPKDKRRRIFQYLFYGALFFNIFIPFSTKLVNMALDINISWPYRINAVVGTLIWPLGGYLLFYYPPRKLVRYIYYFMGACGLLMHIIGTKILSYKAGDIDQTFKGYENLPSVLYSIAVFLFLFQIGKRLSDKERISRACIILSGYTFAVYLIHWYILKGIVAFLDINTKSIFWRLGAPIPVAAIAILITIVLRRIPLVCKIVP